MWYEHFGLSKKNRKYLSLTSILMNQNTVVDATLEMNMYQRGCNAALRRALSVFVLQVKFPELLKGNFHSDKLHILFNISAKCLRKQYSKHIHCIWVQIIKYHSKKLLCSWGINSLETSLFYHSVLLHQKVGQHHEPWEGPLAVFKSYSLLEKSKYLIFHWSLFI